ncbi:bacteriocin [Sphingobacterium sp. DN00404]|uniref:Bacteriocin n=1 Tax=Sphingobacterium micropteri TaxID=2763501 RepID=A0ABR7YTB6_9SPHI|nr:bacteriocin [Sphingobacterium micropteri]MBD1434416.1 bacteriocin [Sphingobacterium micropteri]
MNNLDFKKIGVQELNTKEMNEIEGGALIRINGLFTWLYEAIKSIF